MFGRVLVLCLFTALAVPAIAGARALPIRHGPPIARISHSTSVNWAGYSATNGAPFTRVRATWKQPSASCTATAAYSSFWVGLDGDGSNTVEQTGTDADCSSGKPVYYAWYEMYPKFPVQLALTVRPGNTIAAMVTTNGSGGFTLTIKNVTTGASFTTTQRLKSAQLASAEVIAEAPSSSQGVLPLANFGTASFSAATVNGNPIGSFNPDRINMSSGSLTKASTSALANGRAFTVTWKHS
jgi:hypothetical protein